METAFLAFPRVYIRGDEERQTDPWEEEEEEGSPKRKAAGDVFRVVSPLRLGSPLSSSAHFDLHSLQPSNYSLNP
jgi:hypothetical protein